MGFIKRLQNFVTEVKLLHEIFHSNIVRFYHHYLYPEKKMGYILMEYIEGIDVGEYLKLYPEKINDLFKQAISGFKYLENKNILHRDIRRSNILVQDDGILKIIDLGFGKKINFSKNFDHSVSLTQWCVPPKEFKKKIYDHSTEVYYVGKFFEERIEDGNNEEFEFFPILEKMCKVDPNSRTKSFFDVDKEIHDIEFNRYDFTQIDRMNYLHFAENMSNHITKIDHDGRYKDDYVEIRKQLNETYDTFILEDKVPDASKIINCFLNGGYRYKQSGFPTEAVKDFLGLLNGSSYQKMKTILSNLFTRFDAIERDDNDDIPYDDPF